MYEIQNNVTKRAIIFRASGMIRVDELRTIAAEARRVTDSYLNGPHVVIADMRGLAALAPDGAEVMKGIIGYGRQHGTTLCVHLSDSVVTQLQSNRLAREVSPYDEATINVVSMEEAWRVIDERRGEAGSKAAPAGAGAPRRR